MSTAITKTDIVISDLSKCYRSNTEKLALDNINLQAKPGRILALLGPNGAGKSTLINILSGMTIKTKGRVQILGLDIDNMTERRASLYHLGVVPQEINFDVFFNPIDTLRIQSGFFGISNNEDYIMYLLDRLQLTEQSHTNTRFLSGGMRRRLLIAKALVHKPQIIVLDEPTAGVDVNLRWQLWDMIKEFRDEGKTVILTTHYLEEAEALADDIAVIHHGRLIALETKQKLLSREYRIDHAIDIELKNPIEKMPESLQGLSATMINDRRIRIDYQYQDQELSKILQVIAHSNLQILTINSHTVSLENVFCDLIKDTRFSLSSNNSSNNTPSKS